MAGDFPHTSGATRLMQAIVDMAVRQDIARLYGQPGFDEGWPVHVALPSRMWVVRGYPGHEHWEGMWIRDGLRN